MNKSLIELIELWLKDYEETEEHDNDFNVEMKDDAGHLLARALDELKSLH